MFLTRSTNFDLWLINMQKQQQQNKTITSTINNAIPESVQVMFRLQEELSGSYMAGLTLRKNKHVIRA
jgi:hypothetical protein